MNAWELLTDNSSAVVGATAWQHLQAQNNGGILYGHLGELVSVEQYKVLETIEEDTDLLSIKTIETLEYPEIESAIDSNQEYKVQEE